MDTKEFVSPCTCKPTKMYMYMHACTCVRVYMCNFEILEVDSTLYAINDYRSFVPACIGLHSFKCAHICMYVSAEKCMLWCVFLSYRSSGFASFPCCFFFFFALFKILYACMHTHTRTRMYTYMHIYRYLIY